MLVKGVCVVQCIMLMLLNADQLSNTALLNIAHTINQAAMNDCTQLSYSYCLDLHIVAILEEKGYVVFIQLPDPNGKPLNGSTVIRWDIKFERKDGPIHYYKNRKTGELVDYMKRY